MRPTEVFLSHSSRDRAEAEVVAQILRQHGVPVFYAPYDIAGAKQWQDEILAALKRCDWFAVLITPAAVQSMWVKREVAYALNQSRYQDRIIPLLKEECELGTLDWLDLFQRVDLRNNLRAGCQEILRVWGIAFREDLIP